MLFESVASVIDIVRDELTSATGALGKMSARKLAIECLVEEGVDRAVALNVVEAIGSGLDTQSIIEGIKGESEETKASPKKTTKASPAKASTKASPAKATKASPSKGGKGKVSKANSKGPLAIVRAPDYQGNAIYRVGPLHGFSKGLSEARLRLIAGNGEAIIHALDNGLDVDEYMEL